MTDPGHSASRGSAGVLRARGVVTALALCVAGCGGASSRHAVHTAPALKRNLVSQRPGRNEFYARTAWILASVAPDQRSLAVWYPTGGCAHGARAHAAERAHSVAIVVEQIQRRPGRGGYCTMELQVRQIRVRLRTPLHGRKLLGQARHFPTPGFHNSYVLRHGIPVAVVPRLVGLRTQDALRTMRIDNIKARTPLPPKAAQVVAESPAPGARLPDSGVQLIGR